MNTGKTTSRSAVRRRKQEEIRLDTDPIPSRLLTLAMTLEALLQARREGCVIVSMDEEGTLH